MEYIALDVHECYTWARVETDQGERVIEQRVVHQRGALQAFVQSFLSASLLLLCKEGRRGDRGSVIPAGRKRGSLFNPAPE